MILGYQDHSLPAGRAMLQPWLLPGAGSSCFPLPRGIFNPKSTAGFAWAESEEPPGLFSCPAPQLPLFPRSTLRAQLLTQEFFPQTTPTPNPPYKNPKSHLKMTPLPSPSPRGHLAASQTPPNADILFFFFLFPTFVFAAPVAVVSREPPSSSSSSSWSSSSSRCRSCTPGVAKVASAVTCTSCLHLHPDNLGSDRAASSPPSPGKIPQGRGRTEHPLPCPRSSPRSSPRRGAVAVRR